MFTARRVTIGIMVAVTALALASAVSEAKYVAPLEVEVTIAHFTSLGVPTDLVLHVKNLGDTKNVTIVFEAPEELFVSKPEQMEASIERGYAIEVSTQVIFATEGVYRLGGRATVRYGNSIESKLSIIFVEIRSGVLNVFSQDPRLSQEKMKPKSELLKKQRPGEYLEQSMESQD